jgi:aminoglycoside 6'-N-acetyltransferase I
MKITRVTAVNSSEWAKLCNELWPHNTAEEMLQDFAAGEYQNEYLYQKDDKFVAFISLSIRTDYVEGKEDSNPVGYVEGIYVQPVYRKKGIAKELIDFAKSWAAKQGCSMLASDCELDNHESRAFHGKVGFAEKGINVHFGMRLKDEY